MSRADLLTLLRAWGWSPVGSGNRGAYDRWQKGSVTIRIPSDESAPDAAEWLDRALRHLGHAEGPRLLAVVREVAGLHTAIADADRTISDGTALVCRDDGHPWPCPTARAITAALTEEDQP